MLATVMKYVSGRVSALGKAWPGAQEYFVDIPQRGVLKALAYPHLVGEGDLGAEVIISSATLDRGLGTGGYAMVVAFPENLMFDASESKGHIVKARYTPQQYMTLGVDEQESPWHHLLADAQSIDGMVVISADLHSALPAAVAGIRSRMAGARIAYVMDDGGCLPAWFSRTCATLKEQGHILGTITARQAFGGDLEAVNIHTALLAAKHVWHADIAIVSQGPGNLGTETRWGFSGTSVGEVINATNALGGRALALVRASGADKRERHQGISHHTMTTLTRVALTPALCPLPPLDSLMGVVDKAIVEKIACQRELLAQVPYLDVIDVDSCGIFEDLATSPVRLSTMGRGLNDDPLSFIAAGVAGRAAADLVMA